MNFTQLKVANVTHVPKFAQNAEDQQHKIASAVIQKYINDKDTDCLACSLGCKKCNENNDHQCTQCFPGYYEKKTGNSNYVECTPCPENCQSCQEQGGQLLCTDCIDGFYKEGDKCNRCALSCAKCESQSKCTECIEGYLLENDLCSTRCAYQCLRCENTRDNCVSCRDGYVLNGNTCTECPYGCQICESSSDSESKICLSCQDGFYKEGSECKECDQTCATCANSGPMRCYLCQEGYYKYNEYNYPYLYAGECRRCEEGAANCVECTSECLDDYLESTQSKCDFKCTKCAEKHYLDESANKCESCHSSCKTCHGPGENQCDSCDEGFYPLEGTCTKNPDGKYFDETQGILVSCTSEHCKECTRGYQCTTCYDGYGFDNYEYLCEKCPDDCDTCEYYDGWSGMTCKKCKIGYYGEPLNAPKFNRCKSCNSEGEKSCIKCSDENSCDECYANYYLDSQTKRCSACTAPCETCVNESTKCTSCEDGYGLNENSHECVQCLLNCRKCDSNQQCSECNDGYFLPENENVCKSCTDENCVKCSSPEVCTKCKERFYPNNEHKCVPCGEHCIECTSEKCTVCEHEFYPAEGNKCDPCAEVCSECKGPTAQDCISCDPGYYFSEPNRNCFKCHESCANCTGPNDDECIGCSPGYFNFQNERCSKCESGCLTCESYRICTECKDGFYKKYINDRDTDCLACSLGCKKCNENNDHQCTQCFPGYYEKKTGNSNYVECTPCPENCQSCQEQGGQLLCTDCIDGFYKEGDKCNRCDLSCAKCESQSKCTECIEGFLLENDLCSTRCAYQCLRCENTQNNCVSCRDGYVLNGNTCTECPYGCQICESSSDSESKICLSCQDGFYKEGNECKECDQTCATCANSGPMRCYLCQEGYYKYNEYNYPYLYAGECRRCEEGAANCAECTSECLDDYLESTQSKCDFKCTKCAEKHYLDESTNECESCPANCLECSDSKTCIKCVPGYNLNGTICLNSCGDNQHCDFNNTNATDYEQFDAEEIKYDGTEYESNGGALNIINANVHIINSNFSNCKSTQGAGGGIYILNNIKDETKTYNITIKNLIFTECSALYGGAVFIYSPSKESTVLIQSCDFNGNIARATPNSNSLFGGSALYLVCVNSQIIDCSFSKNKGKGGAVKISDDFASIPNSLRILQYGSNETIGSIEIKGCSFEIEKGSDCSLYYSNKISKVDLMNCDFAGNLDKDAHHIDGQSNEKDYSKLSFNSCTFSDEKRALNNKFIKINMINNHALANSMLSKQQLSSKIWISIATLIFAAIIVFALIIRRQTNDEFDNRDAQVTLDNSLNL